MSRQGELWIVATPIGNLEDITLRALRKLKEADIVACEDTRVTKKLLAHFDIHTPTISHHAHSGERGTEKIIELLESGKKIALVSDAGTPGISDPGPQLVSAVRARLPETRVEAVPGPSALTAAVSIAGLKIPSFLFLGFLPHKKGRETLFAEMAGREGATVFLESPHRIGKTLSALARHMPHRRMGLYRELTKIHEEALVGTPAELQNMLSPSRARGEFVVVVEAQ